MHLELEALFERIESTPTAERFGLRSIPVRNRNVDDLLGLLERLLEVGAVSSLDDDFSPVREPRLQGGTGGRRRAESYLAGRLSITSDPAANRLIAVGEVRLLDQVEQLIRDLDVRHPQVLIETLIVSLSESDTHDLGVELQKIGSSGGAAVQLASLFGLGSPDPAAGVIPPASGTGFGGVVLDPGDFSAVVRALETLNEGRTLNIPKVLVNNNETATLTSVLQTPYVSTNASDTVATTSFGGTLDAGTVVTVSPQIAAGDRLILDYTISLSSFVGNSVDPSVPPPRQENSLQSVVTIPDGHTVVLGALDVQSFTDASARVPILGSIPWLGALFRSDSTATTRNRFFVFLRCSVRRHDGFEDLKYLSGIELGEANLDDGWPVLEPRVIL